MTENRSIALSRIAVITIIAFLAGRFTCAAQAQAEPHMSGSNKILLLIIALVGSIAAGYGTYQAVLDAIKKKNGNAARQKQASTDNRSGNQNFQYQPVEYIPWAKPVAFLCGFGATFLTFIIIMLTLRMFF